MNPWKRWFARRHVDTDLAEEMRAHQEEKVDLLMEQGMSEEEARATVQRQFGNVTLHQELSREAWGWNGIEQFANDVRFGCRLLAKKPTFAVTALLTLALGIGASTAVFTLIDSVILKPLHYRNSGELVVAWERVLFLPGQPVGPNPRHVAVWRAGATLFEGLTLLQQGAKGVTLGTEHPRMVGTVTSEAGLFAVLQVKPLLGRTFRPEDAALGRDNVAVLTFPLWQTLFQGAPNALGKTIRISGKNCEIIGILPEDFQFPNKNALRPFGPRQGTSNAHEAELFIPALIDLNEISWNGEYGNWVAIGRLNPGINLAQANGQLESLEARVVKQMPPNERDNRPDALHAFFQPMHEVVVDDSKNALWLLMTAVIGLLLIGCLNLANAQLSHAVLRQREVGLRSALGASKWRLLSSACAENMVLAALGGIGGICFASAATNLLRRFAPVDLPRLLEVHLNLTVLAFSAVLTLSCCLLFGILPTFKMIYSDPQSALQQNNNRSVGRSRGRQLRILIIGIQVVGCTVLLLLTGLFVKSLVHLLYQDKGFETKQVAVAEVNLFDKTYNDKGQRILFNENVLQKLRAIPGVASAGLISAMPFEGETWIESLQRLDTPQQKTPLINLRWVSPGYFETVHEKLIAGRFFEERDKNANSIILSEGEARALWPNGGALNGQVTTEGRRFAVIGVVADARTASLKSAPPNMAYVHFKDRPPFSSFFLVRGRSAADSLLTNMRQAIWSEAPGVTIARVKTLDSQLTDSLGTERFETFVLIAFAGAALLLSILGIYGVLSYSMASRRQEIGVRVALGATRFQIYWLAFREGGTAVLGGIVIGLMLSMPFSRYVQNMLYDVHPMDPAVTVIVASLFVATGLIATLIPARRAASLNPVDALRSE